MSIPISAPSVELSTRSMTHAQGPLHMIVSPLQLHSSRVASAPFSSFHDLEESSDHLRVTHDHDLRN